MNRYLADRLARGRSENRDSRQGVKGTGRYGRDRGDDIDEHDERFYDRRDPEYDRRERSRDRNSSERYSDRRRTDGRDMRYDDYDDYRDFEYNSDKEMSLSEKDIKKWERKLDNADGSRGPKFHKDQIIPMAKQYGIEFKKDKFTEDEFVLVVNMMYSDYCKALQEASVSSYSKPEPYIMMAKAFLCDEDFEGKPYEKLAAYYYGIVEFDD